MRHQFFILVDKATQHTFPASRSRDNTSHHEFTDKLPPRLFIRHQDALFVARHWAQGHTFQTYAQRQDEHDSFLMTTKPVDGRSLENIEIRAVALLSVPT